MNVTDISHQFSNCIYVINTTPHPISFQEPQTGEKVVIPSSALQGEKTGEFVINAKAQEKDLGNHNVATEFVGSDDGRSVISEINKQLSENGIDKENVKIVGSIIAAQAYPGQVVGMVPAPGFERVPPQEKLMSAEKFTMFENEKQKEYNWDYLHTITGQIIHGNPSNSDDYFSLFKPLLFRSNS